MPPSDKIKTNGDNLCCHLQSKSKTLNRVSWRARKKIVKKGFGVRVAGAAKGGCTTKQQAGYKRRTAAAGWQRTYWSHRQGWKYRSRHTTYWTVRRDYIFGFFPINKSLVRRHISVEKNLKKVLLLARRSSKSEAVFLLCCDIIQAAVKNDVVTRVQ